MYVSVSEKVCVRKCERKSICERERVESVYVRGRQGHKDLSPAPLSAVANAFLSAITPHWAQDALRAAVSLGCDRGGRGIFCLFEQRLRSISTGALNFSS